jgi:hypothetical protein
MGRTAGGEGAPGGAGALIRKSKRKYDRVDAQKLTKLLYRDAVPRAHVPPPAVRRLLAEAVWMGIRKSPTLRRRFEAGLEPTNNSVERALRPAVPSRKQSLGSQSRGWRGPSSLRSEGRVAAIRVWTCGRAWRWGGGGRRG